MTTTRGSPLKAISAGGPRRHSRMGPAPRALRKSSSPTWRRTESRNSRTHRDERSGLLVQLLYRPLAHVIRALRLAAVLPATYLRIKLPFFPQLKQPERL